MGETAFLSDCMGREKLAELKKEGCTDAVIVQHIPIHGYRLASKAAYKEGIDHKALTVAESI